MDSSHKDQISAVEAQLQATRDTLAAESQKNVKLNTDYQLEQQKNLTLTERLTEVMRDLQSASQAKD